MVTIEITASTVLMTFAVISAMGNVILLGYFVDTRNRMEHYFWRWHEVDKQCRDKKRECKELQKQLEELTKEGKGE